jgi:hypothetical protein
MPETVVTYQDVIDAWAKVRISIDSLVAQTSKLGAAAERLESSVEKLEIKFDKFNGRLQKAERDVVLLQERIRQGGRNWNLLLGLGIVILQLLILARIESWINL